MKRFFTLCLGIALACSFELSAQNENDSYIEVHGTAEKSVKPDRISLTLTIDERNYRNRSLEQLEKEMTAILKKVGVNPEKDLKVKNISSSFKSDKGKNQEVYASKSYSLQLADAVTATKIISMLGEDGLANVFVEKVEYSAIDSLKLAARADAVKNAKTIAETMTKAIGQTLGKAFFIYENDSDVSSYAPRLMMTKNAMADALAAEESATIPELDFKDIKVTSRVTVRFRL